jgi:hypothetical protein
MPVNKLHDEFRAVDLFAGWEVPPGYPAGIEQKILSGALDEKAKPGVFTTQPFVHEYWEEVFLVAGDLIVGNDTAGNGGEAFQPFTYACRPPGAYHGPFKSVGGCLLMEIHYFDPV